MSDSAPKKSKSLGATVLALVFAGLYYLAQQMGLINPEADSGGSGTSGGTTVVDSPIDPTNGGGTSVATEGGIGGTGGTGDISVTAGAPASNRPATAPLFDEGEGLEKVADAYANRLSDVILGVEGEVVHLLPDDNEGARHQLFLLELANDITLKISHNIDKADYVPLEDGDRVRVFGEYEWNDRGGVVHWTHLTYGSNQHPHGYIEHEGRIYQ